MRVRPLLFSLVVTATCLGASLLLGSACDSRPVVPIADEEDARADVVPAAPEAGKPADAGSDADGVDAADADAPDADSDAG